MPEYNLIEVREVKIMREINIAKVIASKRKEKGITQDQLAEYIGVTKASVSKGKQRKVFRILRCCRNWQHIMILKR
jgi:DNA-binding XRE family transcriptional regulator